jgi:PhnB protein
MAAQMPVEMKNSILHSSLVSGGITIFASDLNREKPLEGNTVHLCINCENETFLAHLVYGGLLGIFYN